MDGIKPTGSISKIMTQFTQNLQKQEAYWQDSYQKVGSDDALTIPMPSPIKASNIEGISNNEQAFIKALDAEYNSTLTELNDKVKSSYEGKVAQSYLDVGSKIMGLTIKGFNQLLQGG